MGKKVAIKMVVAKNPATEAHDSPAKLWAIISEINAACKASSVFQAVAECVASLTNLMTIAAPLGTNVALITSLDQQRFTASEAQPQMVADSKNALHGFVSDVQVAGQKNVALFKAANIAIRGDAVRLAIESVLPAPLGANAKLQKSRTPVFGWLATVGAAGYAAQIAVAPAAGAAPVFTLLAGTGGGKSRSRKLLDLVPGQDYLLRVQALGGDGRVSAWSGTVTFTAPAAKA